MFDQLTFGDRLFAAATFIIIVLGFLLPAETMQGMGLIWSLYAMGFALVGTIQRGRRLGVAPVLIALTIVAILNPTAMFPICAVVMALIGMPTVLWLGLRRLGSGTKQKRASELVAVVADKPQGGEVNAAMVLDEFGLTPNPDTRG